MRFHPLTWTALGVALLCSPSISTEAFNHNRSSPTFVTKSRNVSLKNAVVSVEDVTTKPIAGMRPGTSGLRKKVDVWQAIDESNKNYVENFIQSLIETAEENNGGKMLDT